MLTLIKILFLTTGIMIIFWLSTVPSVAYYDAPKTVYDYVKQYSVEYKISSHTLYQVMMCESNGNPKAVGDHGLAKNVMQFHEQTFNKFSKELGKEMDYNSSKDQIELAAWAFSRGYSHHWTCYTKLYN